MNSWNDWKTKPVLVKSPTYGAKNDDPSEHFGLTDEHELMYRVHQFLHGNSNNQDEIGGGKSRKIVDDHRGDVKSENGSHETHQALIDHVNHDPNPLLENNSGQLPSKIQLQSHILNHLIAPPATESTSAPSSPLLQRARRLAVTNSQPLLSNISNGNSGDQLHKNSQHIGQQQQKQHLKGTDSDGGFNSNHTANVYQLDGRKRSVSYSNFSNFYE